ncbi:MAG TPA: ion channel [Myxococcales bacterium]|nr:ion channel [Myxococcales bacterium]
MAEVAPTAPAKDGRLPTTVADERRRIVRLGAPSPNPFRDLYHVWLTTSWPSTFALVVILYLAANAGFALLYLAIGGGIEGARPGSFEDAFFFSVQTMATIGYGKMVPVSAAANALVAAEAFMGLLGFSVTTGLVFAKLSRPTARVLFSRVAVVTVRDGSPSLMFRMANERQNQIVDVGLRAVLARAERTAEGEDVRRFHELRLARNWATSFSLTWTAIHPVTEDSPLFGATAESLHAQRAQLIVLITGIDETFSQTIHARHSYQWDEILWNRRFVDVMKQLPDNRFQIDYGHFHDTQEA